jgi:hypothetical protein
MTGPRRVPNVLFQRARQRLGYSRQELADAANKLLPRHSLLTDNDIGKIERGAVAFPREVRRRALRAVLQAESDADLGLMDTRQPPRNYGLMPPWSEPAPACSIDAVEPDSIGGQPRVPATDESRRGLLIAIAAVASGAGLLGLSVDNARRRIGTNDIARIEAVTVLYRSVDYEQGGGTLCEQVGRFAETASALLTHAQASSEVRVQLQTAVASARQLAGWTAFDAGWHSDASRHWVAAERAAVASGDLALAARVRYCQARQYQHLRHNQDALDTLRLAQAQVGGAATPALSAMLHGAEAASLAALGDDRAAQLALDRAAAQYERIRVEREPSWMHFYDQGELLAQYGRVYRDMARRNRKDAASAIHWTQAAVNAFSQQNVRSTVLNEAGLCSALLLAGDPDGALTVGRTLMAHGQQLTSRRVHDRIHNLARDIPTDADSSLADFRDRVTRFQVAA